MLQCRYLLWKPGIDALWLLDTTATGKGALRSSTCRKSEAQSDRFRRRNCTPATRKPARPSRTKRARPGPTGTRARLARRARRPAAARAQPPTRRLQRHGRNSRLSLHEKPELAIPISSMGSGVCTHSGSTSASKEAFCMVDQPNPGDIQPSFSISGPVEGFKKATRFENVGWILNK